MKSPIEMAFARIELMKSIDRDSIHWQMFKDNYIQMEKTSIVEAHVQGFTDAYSIENKPTGEQYYNEKYNNNNQVRVSKGGQTPINTNI